MDVEVLNQILAMVGEAGEGAFTLAVLYLLVPYATMVTWLGIVFFLLRFGAKLFTGLTFIHNAALAASHKLDTSYDGFVTKYGRESLLNKIRENNDKVSS